MKLGVMSDLHLEFADYNFVENPEIDLYINAGDITTATRHHQRMAYLRKNTRLFYVLGNHDFYGGAWEYTQPDLVDYYGCKIAGAVLWSDLSNPIDYMNYYNNLADSRCIQNIDMESYNNTHQAHKKFLFESGADIFVTHHAPSYKSVSEEYIGSALNPGFVTELSEDLLALGDKAPVLWVHGHVHGRFDYMIGKTRVVCNPRGYPNENPWFDTYEPQVVEI